MAALGVSHGAGLDRFWAEAARSTKECRFVQVRHWSSDVLQSTYSMLTLLRQADTVMDCL